MHFASDNTAPVAPEIMAALAAANQGYATSYGDDQIMDRVRDQIRALFEAPNAAVYLVATGTAANALSLACHINPWQAVFCHRLSHAEVDECGAPEFFTNGAKLVVLDGENAKINPDNLRAALASIDATDPHVIQRGILTITQLTERGTAYSLNEIHALTTIARDDNMPSHLDGARFANALVHLGCTPAEMTWKSGIDVVSFGGTKNGLMGVEAVIMFNPDQAWEFELRRKRAGHLLSKHRFLSAQMGAYLTDNLWLDLAKRANDAAARLETALLSLPDTTLEFPRQGNMIFARFPRTAHRFAKAAGAEYDLYFGQSMQGPDHELLGARMVTSWSTSQRDIDGFVAILRG
ncbi:MAG: low specificity L-threonine aldolase [Alphaproteobacteria bacterium]|nr:low specificity L-threonine aldolase [Alphaproteobacteria bacterium]